MKALELINMGANHLKERNISSSTLDSEILLSKILKKSREELLINFDQKINKDNILIYKNLIKRRSKYEPIAYILEEKEFWGKKFRVSKSTLIPRPETELLVDYLIKIFKEKKISILDIGTGTGCIILSLLDNLTHCNGLGIDISSHAIKVAKQNSAKFKLGNRIKFLNKSFINIFYQKFDLIVSNPPYIERKDLKNLSEDIKRYEPRIALDGGNDGLDLIKKVIYKTKYILKVKGMLALEIGNEQYKKVSEILIKKNFRIEHTIQDYKDNIRSIISTKIGN